MFTAVKNKRRLLLGLMKSKVDLNSVQLIFFYGPNFTNNIRYSLSDSLDLLSHKRFDPSKKTVFYIHGYLENLGYESLHVIVGSYLKRADHNVILLNWEQLADGNYMFDAVPNAKQLGTQISKILLNLFDAGLSIKKFHVVGHSLGGQIAGIIGREIIRRSNGQHILKRISALDPAFPPFYGNIFEKHITKNDAEFVDVIHTDAIYGAPVSTGTADFWPNGGGTLQPGCPRRNYKPLTDNDLCSHRRSWWYWAESVYSDYPGKFNASKASSWKAWKRGSLKEIGQDVFMGLDCPLDISGDFYLRTNCKTPFAKGRFGADPSKCKRNDDQRTSTRNDNRDTTVAAID